MLKGYFRKQGVNICSKRIGASLASVAPVYHQQRLTRTERATNPLPYYAQYFGHKIHMDQNEKIAMYGVTHVCATDGYSGRVVSHALMPVKNNLLIYEHVFRWVTICKMQQWIPWLAKRDLSHYTDILITVMEGAFKDLTGYWGGGGGGAWWTSTIWRGNRM